MKEIYFATTNKGKVSSLKRNLSCYKINVIHFPVDLPEPRTDDLGKIAKQKVLAAFKKIKKPVVALDAGFYIYSLKGFPKAFVNPILETIGIEGLLKLTEDKPRECEFRECLAYYDKNLPEPLVFESSVRGKLSAQPKERMKDYAWSKLFLIFIPEGKQKTLSQMTFEEYQRWSRQHHQSSSSYAVQFAKWFLEHKK